MVTCPCCNSTDTSLVEYGVYQCQQCQQYFVPGEGCPEEEQDTVESEA